MVMRYVPGKAMRKSFFALVAAGIVVLSGAASAYEFSADAVMTDDGQTITGRIFAKAHKVRMEMKTPEKMIIITRIDKKVAWSIIPAHNKMYMELPVDPNNVPKTVIRGEIERMQVGIETIGGHPTRKYFVTYKDGSKVSHLYQWMATDIRFPVRIADLNNRWVQEYRNIRIGPQPDYLFELPPGYKKMTTSTVPGATQVK
jgi:hypothetical protein